MRFSAILSSVRPFKDDEYTTLQKAAISSWLPLCNQVVLFNRPEDIGGLVPVTVVKSHNPPSIKEMLQWAMDNVPEEGSILIVNSDIELTPQILKCHEVAEKKRLNWGWAATSNRYEKGENGPEIKGWGLDVFALTPRIIKHILIDIPDHMTIGRVLWDNWLNGWLHAHMRTSHYFDMTPWKCVFHPDHERPNGRVGGDFVNYTDDEVHRIYAAGGIHQGGMPKTIYT